ncbi:MAG: hypothetical protein ACI9HX_000348, partial [Pseudoalteromonas tetraodonis]
SKAKLAVRARTASRRMNLINRFMVDTLHQNSGASATL